MGMGVSNVHPYFSKIITLLFYLNELKHVLEETDWKNKLFCCANFNGKDGSGIRIHFLCIQTQVYYQADQ